MAVPLPTSGSIQRRRLYRNQPLGGSFGSRQHARAPGSRSPLRPPDSTLGSQDAPLHLRRARRDLHHQPRADAAAPRGSSRVRAEPRRERRNGALRRHEEAGPGLDRGARQAHRHAVREPPLAGRAADELAHHLRPDRPPARASAPERRRTARPAPPEGAHLHGRRARAPREPPRRRGGHEAPARRGARHRPAQGGDRRPRGAPPEPAGPGTRRHELRSGRGGLRHSRQRRRDQGLRPRDPHDRERDGGRQAEGRAGGVPGRSGSRAGARAPGRGGCRRSSPGRGACG